ncbi:phage tail spike protein [Staphylococcus borealis]|uniref:phage tail spike protein n=1 Tax=Staphylococcus borealis TaxID=2742203 RepID=UPI00265BD9DB|nr:phage tail spike protein [Staphylococcus borealis]MDO0995378.1 phage tail spike protein [Staphylococcus borealis]
MKQTGIHILDFNDKIIDYISRDDGALLNAVMSINADEKSETFDFTVLNERADNLRERNRIIAQDSNGLYREFVITHVVDNFDGTTEIESNASYLEDIGSSKPIKPGKYSAYSTTQALNETLRNTGWELSDDTEHGGMRTTSWTSYVTPYELINQLCTTYSMVADYYIELSSHTVEHRYVSLKKPVSLFKGKEITKGKDLTGMTRTVDMSEVRTALYAVGPEKEKGERLEKIVTDDDAQMQFGLPGRYLWSVYEPESDDENMTLERLTTLAKTELNKRNKSAISYEISSTDIHKFYKDITISLHDTVRVKDRDFRPPLYLDAEVIAIDYDLLNDESTYKFGNVVEYEESKLRDAFNKRFDAINKKLNDSITNINTIVNDTIAGELEYYERKIIKSDTAPENPVNDMLWYDTSNSDVAVLRRYWNGEWLNETVDDVKKIGGLSREQIIYNDLENTFTNLTIQHTKLQNEVYEILNNEYLVDNDLRAELSSALNDVDNVYQTINKNLKSMTSETATIGKLVDTQALFGTYRQKLQAVYKTVTNAKISIDKRLKLLQSQYTDEKLNDAMNEVAKTLPNGKWDSEKQQLFADIPNQSDIDNLRTSLQQYTDGQINDLNGVLGEQINTKINNTKNEISANISSLERKIDGVEVGGRNLLEDSANIKKDINDEMAGLKQFFRVDITNAHDKLKLGDTVTISFDVEMEQGNILNVYDTNVNYDFILGMNTFENIGTKKQRVNFTKTLIKANKNSDKWYLDFYNKGDTDDKYTISNVKIEKGTIATDWTPAPEDIDKSIKQAQNDAEVSAKAYAETQDELKQIEAKAYADGIVDEEEKRAIADATAKRDEAKVYAEQQAKKAQELANQNTQEVIKPITTQVTSTESDVKVLKGQIGLMAKSDDVTQQLKNVDGRLTPLETTVKSNKATLDLLPDQINSKVSKQDYTTDQNNLVTRLNNADSERKQLSNSISDKVSLKEYENGLDLVKSTNRNYLQSYYSTTQNSIGGITKTPYYVELNASQRINFYFYDRSNGGNPSLKQDTDYILKIHESSSDIKIGVFYKKGSYTIVGYTTDKVIRFNTGNREDILIVAISQSNEQYIGKISLYEGTKELDWSPAPEDIELLGLTAETNAKAYTDAQKKDTDVKLTKMNTDISQNGKDIQLRATKEEFNATNKTLSKTVADFTTNVATGMTFTYNENGTIQAMNIGNDGIKLRGDKVDITVNKEFNVVANKVDNKVGKDEVINRLNLSPEGLDIDVNKVGIRGGDSTNYIYLSQDKIEMAGTFQRTFRGNTQKDNVFMRAQGGYLRFRNNNQNRSLYYSDFGISTYIDGDSSEASGTLQFFDYTYSPTNSVRGVTLNSAGGAVALNSERNRIVLDANATVNIESETSSVYIRPMKENRVGTNEFRFWTKLNDSVADTDGVLSYGSITELVEKAPASYSFGSGIRFDKSPKSRYIYATDKDGNIGTGDFYARNLLGDWWAKVNNLYALVDASVGRLRITDYNGYNNGNPNYKDLQCNDIQSNSIRINTGKDFYIGVSTNELRVTNNLLYNGGNTGYKPVRASDFIKASSAEFKHDIKKWDYDALNVISNELQLYSYKYNDDEKQTIHHGPVIGDGYDIPVEFIFNSGVNTNEMLSWALRAIQQLNEKINILEEQLNE